MSRHHTVARLASWIAIGIFFASIQPALRADDSESLSVQITSPLGRTGIPGTIRIVARVRNPGEDRVLVRFFVDDVMLGELSEGPPYALAWVDENPFETANIRAEAYAGRAGSATDTVTLVPLELVDTAEVASVLLEVSVEDLDGRSVTGLTAERFVLKENEVDQPIDQILLETVPATFTILVDSSRSMSRRIDFVREAAAGLTGFLRPDDRVAVVPFSKDIGPVTGPTGDRATVQGAISAIRATGGTAIVDSVKRISGLLAGVEGRHAILLITDGYDEHSTESVDQAVKAVKSAHATLYVIGVGGVAGISLRGAQLLRKLAEDSGGRAFFPARPSQLSFIHELVSSDVFSRYLITYTPLDQTPDGMWRAISLVTDDKDHKVRTRAGYMAPAPPPVRPSLEFTITDLERRHLDVSVEDLVVHEDGVPQRHPVNRKRVQRLVRQMGLRALYPKPRTSQPGVGHTVYPYLLRGLSIERPNQVWATDICYIPMAHGFMYLVAIMDWYSRRVLAWRVSNTFDSDCCVEARGGPRNSDSLLRWDPDPGEGVWHATEETELSC